MENHAQLIATILMAQCFDLESVDTLMEVDGLPIRLVGRRQVVCDISLPTLFLADPAKSTTQSVVSRTDSESWEEFFRLAEELVRNRRPFYTGLVSGWCWPLFLWQVKVRSPN